ncbi:hypothetical protein ABZ642_39130 [Streptomyces sp. NPDC007157]|uniref:hypothetical protein n=1 Tax=Streptomyces sp. NPDC007157 TaxID=3154681 RepID=UPI0033F49286
MPQDVTFDLPFETSVSDHPEFARTQRPCRIRDMDPVTGKVGFEKYTSWDLPQTVGALPDRSRAGADRAYGAAGVGSSGLAGEAAHLGSGGRATPDGPRALPDRHS